MNNTSLIEFNDEQQHIMFVDDEPHIGLFAEVLLSNKGYKVTRHTSGQDALTDFIEQPYLFDLIITDQNMPKMSGTELSKNILAIRPGMPIILCTGFGAEDIKEQTKDISLIAYITKPFQPFELLEIINDNLSDN